MDSSFNNAGCFLAAYSALLLRSGATCARLEQNVARMAASWNISADITIMPRHVTIAIKPDGEINSLLFSESTANPVISFEIISRLSQMSWEVADNGLTIDEAARCFSDTALSKTANKWWVLFAAACANGAFCKLFGGDFSAVGVVTISTLCGFYIKQLLTEKNIDIRITFFICAFVSAVLACADSLFALGATPNIAIATSVLYLVPGIPLLNSFSDMIARHYICFFSRLSDALILVCCLSMGFCAALWLMRLGLF